MCFRLMVFGFCHSYLCKLHWSIQVHVRSVEVFNHSTMYLENIRDSSKLSFKMKAVANEFASPDVLIKHGKRKILAVRNFPEGCGPPKRLENGVHCRVPATADGLKFKDKLMVPFDKFGLNTEVELLETFLQDSLDNAGFVNASEISIRETTVMATKIMLKVAQGYLLPAIRCFPQGCGRKSQQINEEVVPESIDLKTEGLGHSISDVDNTSYRKKEEVTSKSGCQKNIAITSDRNMLQSNSECSETKDETLCENEIDKCLDEKSSCQSSMPLSQEMTSAYLEFPGHRTIVQALMAAPNCPWRKRKRRAKKH